MGTLALLAATAGIVSAQQAPNPGTPNPAKEPETKRERVYTGNEPQAKEPEWADQVKNPVPWFNWGADFRLRDEYLNNATTLNDDAANHERDFLRYRFRTWGTVTPVKDLDLNARVMWEGRYWWDGNPDRGRDWDRENIIFDNLNAKASNVFNQPLTLTAGRQDMRFNEGWLVFEGTPLDGSRTIYFDAARATYDCKPGNTSLDLIYINNSANPDRFLGQMWGREDQYVTEQNEQGAIVYLTNRSIKDTELNGYFIYKHDQPVLVNGDQGDIYTFGARAAHNFDEHWNARGEGAYQFGNRFNPAMFGANAPTELSAYGFNGRISYLFNDQIKNQLRLSYEYLSGDDPNSSTNGQFDPLWGRWPQWSELYIYTYAMETRVAETTNLQRVAFGWQANPTQKLELAADYHLLFANDNTFADSKPTIFTSDGKFRGQLFTAVARYKFNRYMAGHLWGEYFIPGDYYTRDRRDNAVYLRAELVFTF